MVGNGMAEAMKGAIMAIAIACLLAGGLIVWLVPIVWAWLKPIIHAATS